MNAEIWKKIEDFDLDAAKGEYDFSIRLASENAWTKAFTRDAILEYKKFMYLAATENGMVSPSEIVDVVWHQHLIFTQSYQKFCDILGKTIQHIPSTHHQEEAEKFREAQDFTKTVYQKNFGEAPPEIWKAKSMIGSLPLKNAKTDFALLFILISLVSIMLFFPMLYFFKPLIITINNPDFIIFYSVFFAGVLLATHFLTNSAMQNIIKKISPNSFIFKLEPYELIYLQKQHRSHVINGTLSELISNSSISVDKNGNLKAARSIFIHSKEQWQVMQALKYSKISTYSTVYQYAFNKPVFKNIAQSMNLIKKSLQNSLEFQRIFLFIIPALILSLNVGFIRIYTGIERGRPITQIIIAMMVFTGLVIFFLIKKSRQLTSSAIPNFYKTTILPKNHKDLDWQWAYFIYGSSVLATSFMPVYKKPSPDQSSGGCSSSSNSSCGGASCGSCGGCGGS